ncbi:PREDICTED: uncharacterized protein LOC109229808 [Nicotiana attenuata]|uniref:uncharacterized protein LOC109229808 n=1 Tax=Nicotiana attenuata TaxID=49451 RepID=UPI000904C10E|nr:PREDICTED: uncharacterized protein LOC109229808 [Nicotiana attenuata]
MGGKFIIGKPSYAGKKENQLFDGYKLDWGLRIGSRSFERPSVHNAFLASISEKIRYQGQSEHRFPSTDRWPGRKDHSDSRRYAACMCYRFWRSPVGWFEPAEVPLIGPEFVYEALEKVQLIRERLKAAQSRQKSYSDKRHRELEFMVGDKVFLKVSPMKGVMRFGKKGKLSPRFIGPYEILEKKGNVAYKLALPVESSSVHPVFHVSMLRKYIHDESHVITADTIEIKEGLTYEEVPIEILDRQVRKLRTKDIASVKVLWSNHDSKEATWEVEEDMRKNYPYLFE